MAFRYNFRGARKELPDIHLLVVRIVEKLARVCTDLLDHVEESAVFDAGTRQQMTLIDMPTTATGHRYGAIMWMQY